MNKRIMYLLVALFFLHNFNPTAYADDDGRIDLLAKLKEARMKLQSEQVDLVKDVIAVRRVRVGRRKYREVPVVGVVARQIALTVMDSSGDLQVVRALKREKQEGLEVLTPGVILSLRREDGINSDIACLQPANGKVLAIKYPVQNENNRFGNESPVIQAIYTPYSPEIKTDDLVKEGLKIQAEFINKAYDRLKSRDVMSAVFPPQKVAAVIPKDILKILL